MPDSSNGAYIFSVKASAAGRRYIYEANRWINTIYKILSFS